MDIDELYMLIGLIYFLLSLGVSVFKDRGRMDKQGWLLLLELIALFGILAVVWPLPVFALAVYWSREAMGWALHKLEGWEKRK